MKLVGAVPKALCIKFFPSAISAYCSSYGIPRNSLRYLPTVELMIIVVIIAVLGKFEQVV